MRGVQLFGQRVLVEPLDENGARHVHAVLGQVRLDLLARAGELALEETGIAGAEFSIILTTSSKAAG